MGIETQAVLLGHLSVDDVCSMLSNDMVRVAGVRPMHRPEYKIVEIIDHSGEIQTLNIFLNSFAASDYEEVFSGESTLVTADFNPQNFQILNALAVAAGGYVQRVSGEPWVQPSAQV